jgi:hypothetical protein
MTHKFHMYRFSQFIAASPSERLELVQEQFKDNLAEERRRSRSDSPSGGGGYFAPGKSIYRRWLQGEIPSKPECIRELDRTRLFDIPKEDNREMLRHLLGGDLLSGSDVLRCEFCEYQNGGIRVPVRPDLTVRRQSERLVVSFFYRKDASSADQWGNWAANIMRLAQSTTGSEPTIHILMDVRYGRAYTPSADQHSTKLVIDSAAMVAGQLFHRLAKGDVA